MALTDVPAHPCSGADAPAATTTKIVRYPPGIAGCPTWACLKTMSISKHFFMRPSTGSTASSVPKQRKTDSGTAWPKRYSPRHAPSTGLYANLRLLVVANDGYAYYVPYVVDGNTWFLKTVEPDRTLTVSSRNVRICSRNRGYLDQEAHELIHLIGELQPGSLRRPSGSSSPSLRCTSSTEPVVGSVEP